MKKISILILLCLPVFCLAQQNFKPGYVITLKGDTLKGVIDYREWDLNPEKINFKTDAGAAGAETYTVKNAKAFGLKNLDVYENFTVSISQGSGSVTTGNTFVDTSKITAPVFLKLILKGSNVSLYSYTDAIKTRYYTYTADTQPEELDHHLYFDDQETQAAFSTRYRVQLNFLAQKFNMFTDNVAQKIARTNFTGSDLTKAMLLINKTTEKQLSIKEKSVTKAFIGAGVNFTTIKYNTDAGSYDFSKNATIKNSVAPLLTGGIDIYSNKVTRKKFLRLDLTLLSEQHTISESLLSYTVVGVFRNSTVDFKQYSAVLGVHYGINYFTTATSNAYVSIGMSIKFSSYNDYKRVDVYASSPTVTQAKPLGLGDVRFLPIVNTGYQFGHIGVFAGVMPISINFDKLSSFAVQGGVQYFFK